MMIFSLISAVNDSVLLPARAHFPLDENDFVEPAIIGGDEERTVQFCMLLDQLKLYPYETADPLCVSINAVTPCCGESNTYQLAVSTGPLPLYVSEISEVMKDFLYQHVVDANGYVRMTSPDICNGLNSLWRKFAEENLSGTLKAEKVLCSPYIMPVPVPGETSSLEEEKMMLKDVKNFKKIQSAFKHELHSIQKSLNVLNSHEAVERFKENKALELLLQTGVHSGIGIAGGVLGAVIGTAIAPGLGTLVGAGIGAGLAWAGKTLYDYAAGVVSNKINPNPHLKTREIDRKIKSAEKGTVWECGAKIKSLVVEPSRAGGILVSGLISSVIKGVSLPINDIATACHDYERASKGLTPEKASKIEALLVKYHSKLNKEYEQVLGYLEENPTPDNQRRKNKILKRDAVICERLAAIRESIKNAVESRC
ncbi:hypothetical protein DPD00_00625 [Salmonella enterica subsp. enterica serovar Bijlmer]|nr:hypothetical protein [Salmonella enterica subsp. enterica serovar Bijlmer]ECB4194417.1 hypothetical protein [Salmonella enterica subsp. enterica serovar Bijlmer]